ncbi:GNAT superfamily N-acetyltransferase [Pedobacter sp. AK013]|uniref:GNAT family N-acetyltransferase n=1 Tax=Pedobacter sp. AK013 TaxID=2723071 RepID=UPI001616B0C3|nr:GNAT family N-acetyltransferase [Pedobacter sp. AK013]MBB6237321.1 GNAT superfamily N-acetyltransferase [Pedobacter sp. AK013]
MSDLTLIRTDSEHTDFRTLVALLDQDLAIRDGDDHSFYAQFNKIDNIRQAIVAYHNGNPVGCGAIKPFSATEAEVKRMFVHPDNRKQGIAAKVLNALESWAAELGFTACVLETGKKQPEAFALYKKVGYNIIPNYGQYIGVDNSVCMSKLLNAW